MCSLPAVRPVLTPGCLGPVLLALMGMELGPFREEACVLVPLVTMDGLLREEVGLVTVWVFFQERKKMDGETKSSNDSDHKTEK